MTFVYSGQWYDVEADRAVIPAEVVIGSSQRSLTIDARLIHRRSVRVLHASAPLATYSVASTLYSHAPIRTSRDTRPSQYLTATGADAKIDVDVYDAAGVLVGSTSVTLGAAPSIASAVSALALASDSTYYLDVLVTPLAATGTVETLRFEELP